MQFTDQNIIDGVLAEFLMLCKFPRGSAHEKAVSDYLFGRLEALGAKAQRDSLWNIWADIPASAGREKEPVVALQAHMDMVCAIGDAAYRPMLDPILATVRDGWLSTEGRSALGADCGAGLALILWILEQRTLSHPPLRILFTAQEENGLIGARAIPKESVAGVSALLNLDGFALDRILVGSAGGMRERYTRRLETVAAPAGQAYRITLSGLNGGHSGFDIVKKRANAIILMGEVLRRLQTKTPFAIASFAGGEAFNAIPYHCTAEIISAISIGDAVAEIAQDMMTRHRETDPNSRLCAERCAQPARVWSGRLTADFLTLLGGFADGIYAMDPEHAGIVHDSSNLGRIQVEGEEVYLEAMIRFMDPAARTALHQNHMLIAGMSGFTGGVHTEYPIWRTKESNSLVQCMAELYRIQMKRSPDILVQHVGLEPSYFLEKNADMACISMGMDIEGCHSPDERWRLGSIPPLARMLMGYLGGR